VGLSGNGAIAVASVGDGSGRSFRAYDVTGRSGPFPPLAAGVPVTPDTLGYFNRLVVDDDGQTAFGFTIRGISQDQYEFYLLVRTVLDAGTAATEALIAASGSGEPDHGGT
jgi:hypothetical protein